MTTTEEDAAAKQAKQAKLRKMAVAELIKTEETYVNQLKGLIQYYVDNLQSNTKFVSKADYSVLFPPDLKMICNLNQKLLMDLSTRIRENNDDSTLIISDIFLSFAPFFKMYQVRYTYNTFSLSLSYHITHITHSRHRIT